MTDIPWIVSLDDHVVEPPDVWTKRLPAKYRDVGPHIVMAPPGTPVLDGGTYREAPGTEGDPSRVVVLRGPAVLGEAPHRRRRLPGRRDRLRRITFDQMRPGCWQPQARLDDMTMNHVEASLAFPNYPRFCGQIFLKAKDKELARLCVEAYNDWQVDEWCAGSDGRLIPLCLVPLWDVELAAAEVRRNAARGREGGRVLRAAAVVGARRASTPDTGTRSSPRARRPAPSWRCTSARAPRRSRRRTTRPTRCRRSTCSPTARSR